MVAVPLGVSTFRRNLAQTPEVLLTNMFVEKDPTNLVDGLVRLQRPGLAAFSRVGNGPVRGMYQQAGTFDGQFFVISGNNVALLSETAVKTTIMVSFPGSGHVIMAAGKKRLITTSGAGGALYSYDGTALTQVIAPDDIGFTSVEYMNGYFLASEVDSDRVWFLPPDETEFDGLDYFSAENSGDKLVRIKRNGDELWLFGEATIEVWVPTGNADLPFQRVEGRLFSKGCASGHTVVGLDNTLFWVGNDKIVYRADNVPQRISDNGIEERLRKNDGVSLSAWAFAVDGHLFYCLTIPDEGTFAYDVSTQTWVRFNSYNRDTWRAHIGAQSSGSFIIAGDDATGDIWKLSPERSNDAGEEPIIRELVGGLPLLGKPQRCNSFTVCVASGNVAPRVQPKIMFRYSDDGGNLWTDWDYISIGKPGDYQSEWTVWQLGLMRPPGRVFHLRMTDNAVFRISYARVNEAYAA